MSFVGALILLTILVAVKERPFFNREGMKAAPWWAFLGGIPGSLFVFFIGIVVPVLGPGMGAILGLMGMLIGTIIVQQFGWYQSVKKRVNYMQILGIIIMVVGVALIQLV
ncbi:DMT family transporter [Weissella confusa]|uniref:DMT family transporter n=1 Tax=Weissella confusa TaxID=1583 RepID=UPI0018F26208|nr:DMT family transporter [Weissella confusa]MBJ7617963.1 DMT family transporter [Weissella confusa]MBJ7625076.1 DMT family transporter [Weissella confusa]MBJ7651436.1 DMT family transporter [Weissella confusa]MBJ7676519.1 DMT family transporter [Weissella confusa]